MPDPVPTLAEAVAEARDELRRCPEGSAYITSMDTGHLRVLMDEFDRRGRALE